MTKSADWALLFFALYFFSGCGNSHTLDDVFPITKETPCPTSQTVTTIDDDTVRFCGEISESTVQQAISVMEHGHRQKLVIDSLGGNTSAAIKLGRYINSEGIPVYG